MPRSFTPEDKIAIRARIIEKGTGLFGQFGLKKTSIDEIVRAAGIAKGSFYKFFPSKEALFFSCMELQELDLQEKYLKPLFSEAPDTRKMFENLFGFIFRLPTEYPLINTMMNTDEYAALVRGLPEEMIKNHRDKDQMEMGEFLSAWKKRGIEIDENPAAVNGLFQALALINFHKEEIGAEIFEESTALLAKVLSAGMSTLYCGEKKDD